MEAAQTVEITPLSPRAAFMELFTSSYRLDISDRARLRQAFDRYTELSVLPLFYRLAYPRNLAVLPDVRSAILDHLRTA
jgi:hypothetical protein